MYKNQHNLVIIISKYMYCMYVDLFGSRLDSAASGFKFTCY